MTYTQDDVCDECGIIVGTWTFYGEPPTQKELEDVMKCDFYCKNCWDKKQK